MSPSRLVQFLLAPLLAAVLVPVSAAQITAVTNDQSTPVPGAGHDYIHMLDETVNPANGSVSLRLNVPVPKGRGLTIPFGFAYDSNGFWHLTSDGANGGGSSWISDATILSQGGWSYSAPLASYFSFSAPWINGGGGCSFTSNFVFQDSTGGRHGLGLSTSNDGQGGDGSAACGLSPVSTAGDDFLKATTTQPLNTVNPPVWVANLDGSVSYFSMSNVHQWASAAGVALPDYIEDRNGNKILFHDNMTQQGANRGAFTYTDTLGRTILSSSGFGATGNTVSVSGLSGNFALTWGTATSSYSINSLYLNPPGNCNLPPHVSGNQGVVTTLALPNGKSYQFYYDSTYGLLNKVVYPTGGYVRYAWSLNSMSDVAEYAAACSNPGGVCNPPGYCDYRIDTPAVSDRYVSFDGTTEVLHQHFAYSTNWPGSSKYWSTKQTTVTTYDMTRGGNFQTAYTYGPSGCGAPDPPNVITTIAFQCPVEQTVVYKGWDNSTLRTATKSWQDVNILLSEQVALENGQTSKTSYSYLNNNTIALQTEKDEYDFGQGSPGALLRKTVVSYQSFPNTPIYQSGPSIFDRPSSTITYDGSGNRVAETDYTYDQTGVSSTSNLPAGTHDETNYSASYNNRGNATTVVDQCLNGTCTGGNPTTKYTYDETGQTLTRIDPCGSASCGDMPASSHTTTYSYTDNFDSNPSSNTNAYLTRITDPLGHFSTFKYAYSDGQLISSIDANSKTTSYLYNDSLRRLTETDFPDGGKTTLSYDDSAPSPSVTTSRLVTSSPSLSVTSVAVMDGLGHVTQTQLTTDPDGSDYTANVYDGLGRPYQTYNPTRCTTPTSNCGESTWGVTTTLFDALGRSCLVVPPDGTLPTGSGCPTTQPTNTVLTVYSGNCTTVADQSGKARKSCSDGLGRLTQVFEDPAGLNYETDYGYDVLGNLRCVGQKGTNTGLFSNCASIPVSWRPRSFAYDSLSRLTSATNPESGTVTYSYDVNGNLSAKTSPAPNQTGSATVTATYSYDALNRLTQKSFSDGSTPTIKYGYDAVALTGCAVAPPSLSDANPIGSRTAMCDGAGAESWSHDSLGRPLTDQRTTNGVTKSIPYTYNLDGSLASLTYRQDYYPMPINFTPGGAGRPISVGNSSFGLAYSLHYAPNGSLCSLYSAWGLVFVHNYTFNNRFQPTAIQDMYIYDVSPPAPCSTTTAPTIRDNFNLSYSYTDASGHNNGDVQRINNNLNMESTQLFTYDSLNRLATAETLHQNQPWWQGDPPLLNCWGEQFNYDAWGNLTGISPVSSAYTGCTQENWSMTPTTKNQLQDTNNDYVYDAAGNLIQPGPIGGPYVFDAENHLISAGGMAYLYDGDGKRVGKAPASTRTQPNYLYWYGTGSQILEETDGAGNYLYLDYYFNGTLLARTEPNNWVDHFFADALGNTRCVYGDNDPDGGCSDYYPFGGERPIPSCCPTNPGGVNVPFKFTGKERDSESGLDDFGARYFGSSLGRFMSPDGPFSDQNNENPQSWNLYTYARNNPLRFTDADGRACVQQEDGSYKTVGTEGQSCEDAAAEEAGDNHVASAVVTPSHDDQIKMFAEDIGNIGTAQLKQDVLIMAAGAAGTLADAGIGILGARGAVARGGIAPVLKGAAGVERAIAEIEAEGGTVIGTNVTIKTGVGKGEIVADVLYKDAEGNLVIGEAKNGPTADFNPNQRANGYPQGGPVSGTIAGTKGGPQYPAGTPISNVPVRTFPYGGANPK